MPRKPRPRRRPPASRPGSAQKSPAESSSAKSSPAQSAANRELTTKRRGELAELAFTLKATALGFTVSKPYGESNRYDFIVDFCGNNHAAESDPAEAHHVDSHCSNSPKEPANRKAPHRKSRPDAAAKIMATQTITMIKTVATNTTAETIATNTTANTITAPTTKNPAIENAATKKLARKNPPLRQQIANISADQLPRPSSSLWRVQVKCSTQLLNGLYRVNAHRRINGRAVPYLPSEIDFFAVYIIPEDTWYIIPLLATRRRTSLLFRRHRDPRPGLYDPFLEAWPLLHPRP